MSIVMSGEDAEDTLEMLGIQNQQSVETFPTNRPHESLRDCVRPRRADRRPNQSDTVRGKYRIEAPRELLITIADQKANRLFALGE